MPRFQPQGSVAPLTSQAQGHRHRPRADSCYLGIAPATDAVLLSSCGRSAEEGWRLLGEQPPPLQRRPIDRGNRLEVVDVARL